MKIISMRKYYVYDLDDFLEKFGYKEKLFEKYKLHNTKDILEISGKSRLQIIEELLEENKKKDEYYFVWVDGIYKFEIVFEYEDIRRLADKFLIANWYSKSDIEEMIGERLTNEEYKQIIGEWNSYGNFDIVSEIIEDFVLEWKKRREEEVVK